MNYVVGTLFHTFLKYSFGSTPEFRGEPGSQTDLHNLLEVTELMSANPQIKSRRFQIHNLYSRLLTI